MNIKKLMRQAKEMQEQMEQRMGEMQVEGTAGGGVVRIVLNGKRDLLSIDIDEDLLSPENREMLEEMIVVSFREATEKIDEETGSMMQSMTGGLPLP